MANSAYLWVLFSFKQLQHISMSSKEMKSSNYENPKYEDYMKTSQACIYFLHSKFHETEKTQ